MSQREIGGLYEDEYWRYYKADPFVFLLHTSLYVSYFLLSISDSFINTVITPFMVLTLDNIWLNFETLKRWVTYKYYGNMFKYLCYKLILHVVNSFLFWYMAI